MRFKSRLLKRILSFVLTVNIIFINICFEGIIPNGGLFSFALTAESAYSPTITDENSPMFDVNTNGVVNITSLSILKDYAYYYANSTSFADRHEDDRLQLTLGASEYTIDTDYIPLGTSAHPFNGSLLFTAINDVYTLQTYVPLFDYITDDAVIGDNVTLNICNQATDHALLANHITAGNGTAEWNLYIDEESAAYAPSVSYSGIIGEMQSNAEVKLNVTDHSSAAVSYSTGDAGMICDTMQSGSKITLSLTKDNAAFNVTSTSGNAGALVGSMYPGSSVELVKIPAASSSSTVTASGSNFAGGLAGYVENASINVKTGGMTVGSTTGVTVIPVSGSVNAEEGGAGGLYGYYTTDESEFDLKEYNITSTVYAKNCGGVFGVLEKNKVTSGSAVSLTIKNTKDAGTVNVSSGNASTYGTTGHFGGIIGKYLTDDIKNSLILDNLTVSANSNASFDSFGGAIGFVESAAYIKADDLVINATGTAKRDSLDYFGGLIGKTTAANGVFADVGDFELSSDSSGFKGGGIVGNFEKGVLRLSGITDMSSAKSQRGGQLVGVNNNVLVYALGTGANGAASVRDNTTNAVTTAASGWSFKRSSSASQVDDLGTWGEVVRIADIESADGILTYDSANHTVTVKAAVTTMESQADFAKTALNIQLNQGSNYDCLLFTAGDANKRSSLLSNTLSLTDDISLTGSGITGLMRDGSSSVGEFTGTLNGNSHTVTLAIGEAYGLTGSGAAVSSGSEGVGQIYRHQYNGLFAIIGKDTSGTGTVNSLTIAGSIDVHNKRDGMNIGGIAAVSRGNTTLNNITANQTVNYRETESIAGTETAGKNIGGIIGIANNGSDNGTIAITGTNAINTTFNISDNFQSWNTLGAFIGKVTSPKFTINIAQDGSDKLTVSHTMSNGFTSGADANGGGLIGYITSGTYSNRKINIKNLDFDGCTIVNKATANGGGFLGYAWLDTDTKIEGLTVTDGTITNTSPNVGVMCYEATGRWTVDDLEISKMSLSGGAGTSLGMLVNKAYNTNGLYLDVLNAGYTLMDKSGDTGISLPDSLGVYDELAAYSAGNVVNGTNAGVISVNMNADRTINKTKVTETGTYQNKLTSASSSALGSSKYANANSRYYYNLDKMSKSNVEENIMLWSVNRYAASNIKELFDCTSTPFAFESVTDVKLSDYSYYPVYSAPGLTLSNINVEFGYSGIYALEGNGNNDTDSYNRDPGAQNQHYLMQSGLFINSGEGANLTLRNVKFSGDFLENSTYQGVLISGTAKGSIDIDGLVLDGITPVYNNSGTVSTYKNGYLLVNKVRRETAFKPNIQINLKNISTSSEYTDNGATATVSKSLFGDVYGPAIGINVESIKLDARSSSSALSGEYKTALDNAYKTVNSIFTTATLFNSLKTSQASTMIYNYTWDEDWGVGNRNVTYGKEVSESVEYADKENKYYNSVVFTDPVNNTHTSEPEYNFSSWRPYVAQAYSANQTQDANGCFYRELKVNVPATAYAEGCGTYNDPYIIDSGAKLTAIAALINSAGENNINASSVLPTLQLPKTLYNGVAANTTGARWCNDKNDHAVYTYSSTNGGQYESSGLDPWSVENVRLYLANAYYSLASSTDASGNIELSSDYLGLGGTDDSGKYAFRGVIVGNSTTILNNSKNPLVKVSNGCVLKDVNIIQNVDVAVDAQTNAAASEAYFGYNSGCKYYGGMIGEIMGGDNIIDNSYVSYGEHTVTLTGNYGTIVPVGGYVGVIVFGGLIFRNMTATDTVDENTVLRVNNSGLKVYYNNDTSNNLAANTNDAKAAIYVNPIVGRVINGYAVNESDRFSTSEDGTYHDDDGTQRTGAVIHTLKNGKKHYSIADINKNESAKLDVTAVAASNADGNINVPNAQALFILSLITQSTAGTATDSALGAYNSSLSYGIYGVNVYGMSHIATYNDVGTDTALVYDDQTTENVDESNLPDYQKFARLDTANNANGNAPIPYIVKHYTVGDTVTGTTTRTETRTRTWTETVYDDEITHYEANKYTGATLPSGPIIMKGTRTADAEYLTNIENRPASGLVNNRNCILLSTYNYVATDILTKEENKIKNATKFYFGSDSTGTFIYCLDSNNQRKYLAISNVNNSASNRGNLEISTTPCYFTVTNTGTNWQFKWQNDSKDRYVYYDNNNTYFSGYASNDPGSKFELYTVVETTTQQTHEVTHEEEYEVTIAEYTTTHNYPARCVTSTTGYYDINLNGSDSTYQLPDSFRGLGCVGIYDSKTGKNNLYSIKLDVFDGNEKTIDADIFLNKFNKDNYFNSLHGNTNQDTHASLTNINGNTNTDYHGIGLFDSVIMKGSGSKFCDFELSGSVRTAIYNYLYSSRGECHNIDPEKSTDNLFLSVGGVCGWATNNPTNIGFESIDLNDLIICGTNHFGGLLGYSGLKSPKDKNDKTLYCIWIKECSADSISLKATAGTTVGDARQARCGMGAFIGKIQEGAVYIYGTEYEDDNPDPDNDYSEVLIKNYELVSGDTLNYNMSAGGLIGFAGNGCKIYDMRLSSKNETVTIGGNLVNFAGGIVGGMQSSYDGGKSGIAIFKNCTVANINVNGNYAGGIYGGKWDSNWTTYMITMDNCQMIGTANTHNTIFANDSFGDRTDKTPNNVAYAGGLIGKLYPYTNLDNNNQVTYNVLIKDCLVKNYDITAANTAQSYAGGFIGYASSVNQSVTCYMYNSSVENCKIGANGNYAGGIIGRIMPKADNQILGYNIKLDTITTDAGNKMGAWIGYVPSDDSSHKTSIQLVGMAIYGNGFTKNVGNNATLGTASFVFADYDGACKETTENNAAVSAFNDTNNVDMPKYPYVNINPQSAMGTSEIISGDGAVLYYDNSANRYITMAEKIYSELNDESNTRRYTSFANDEIHDGKKINAYITGDASNGDYITTWKTATGNNLTDVDDFAMIVIANEGAEETTKLITRYIQLVTNTSTDYSISSDYYNVVPSACVYNNSTHNFEITNGTASISYTPGNSSTNAFTVERAGADSLTSNKFTLLDVQFKDPLDTSKVAYHLYVPVYVMRSISATFSSTALSGTNALSTSYTGDLTANNLLIENLDNWITTYIRYKYSADDINAILNAGSLDWNGSKQVKMFFSPNATGSELPDGTKLVLIDPNGNSDRAYYASGSDLSGNTFSLSDFHKNYSGGDNFAEQHFCDILDGNVTVADLNGTENEGTGYYNRVSSTDDYDIKIGDYCYSYVPEKNGRYSLTASGAFNEDYYISMLVPSDNNGYVYFFDIKAPESIAGTMATYVTTSNYTNILLGDLFEQNFTAATVSSTSGNEVINESNNTITVTVTSIVKLNDTDKTRRGFYANYLDGTPLYHADVVTFTRHDANGSDNIINGTNDSNISSSGTVDGAAVNTEETLSSSYITVRTGDICSQVISGANTDEYDGATISQTITVTFPNFEDEFPTRPADQESNTYGVNAAVSSNISYDNDDLTYSGKKITYTDTNRFYVENANMATLKYEANDELDIYDSIGSASFNYSRLGNNGIDRALTCMYSGDEEGMPVNATAKYNAGAITNYDDAHTVRYTLTLYKKTDVTDPDTGDITGVEYQQVDIDDYLKNVKVYGGSTTPLTKNAASDDQKYVYVENISDANVDERVFTVGTYFEIVTGESFHDYANYKVILEVRLLTNGGATISNSTQKDHIIYTNAKVYPEVIQN